MKALKIIISILTLATMTACSTQNREATAQIDETELFELFYEINGGAGALDIQTMANNGSAILYHAREANGRPAESVLALADMSTIIDGVTMNLASYEFGVDTVDVIFADIANDDGTRVFSLSIQGTDIDGQTFTFANTSAPGDFVFTDDEFEVSIPGANGQTLVLRSNDLSEKYNEELADSVKLTVYVEENGQLYYAGHISTMAGYGKRN
jgi:hypothetical protein